MTRLGNRNLSILRAGVYMQQFSIATNNLHIMPKKSVNKTLLSENKQKDKVDNNKQGKQRNTTPATILEITIFCIYNVL